MTRDRRRPEGMPGALDLRETVGDTQSTAGLCPRPQVAPVDGDVLAVAGPER